MFFAFSKPFLLKLLMDMSTKPHDDHLDFFFFSFFSVFLTNAAKLFLKDGSNLLTKDFNRGFG